MSRSERRISLAHGNGGRLMRELIEAVFERCLANPGLDTGADAAPLPVPADTPLMVSTDGFTVQPLEFPGGNIGSLAVHGTVNDLAVAGADPLYLTLNAFIEEGLELDLLERLVTSMGEAAREADVSLLAGDTKVLPKGLCGGVYFATTGIGVRRDPWVSDPRTIETGDVILVSGTVGDHGAAVMLAREDFGWQGDLRSDSGSVIEACRALRAVPGLRFMRDPTRGGLATVVNDLARTTGMTLQLDEETIPIDPQVSAVCEILGFDPLYLASEGRVVAVVAEDAVRAALSALRACGCEPAAVGRIVRGAPEVLMKTALGGERLLDELEEDPLPRIC